MRILLVYGKDEYTTGCYFEEALLRNPKHKVVSAGITKPGLASSYNNQSRIETPASFPIQDLLRQMPEKPDLILHVQGIVGMELIGVEDCGVPTAFYGIDTHTQAKDYLFHEANKYKYVFFAHKQGVADFKAEYGKESNLLPCCAEPLIHKKFDQKEIYDIAFIGGTDLEVAHKPRRDMLKQLNEKYRVFVGNAYGYYMSMIYSQAKVVFNHSVNNDVNMRLFEGMAMGKAVLQNELPSTSGLSELFEDGKHYVAYNESNLIEKVNKLVSDKEYREAIGNNAKKEVLAKHTYDCRIEEIIKCLK